MDTAAHRAKVLLEVTLPLGGRRPAPAVKYGQIAQEFLANIYEIGACAARMGGIPVDMFHTEPASLPDRSRLYYGATVAFDAWDRRIEEFTTWVGRRFRNAEIEYNPDSVIPAEDVPRVFNEVSPERPAGREETWLMVGTRSDGSVEAQEVPVSRSEAYGVGAARSAIRQYLLASGRWEHVNVIPHSSPWPSDRSAARKPWEGEPVVVIGTGAAKPVASEMTIPVTVSTIDGKFTETFCGEAFIAALPHRDLARLATASFAGRLADRLVFEAAAWLPDVSALVHHATTGACEGFRTTIDADKAQEWMALRGRAVVISSPSPSICQE